MWAKFLRTLLWLLVIVLLLSPGLWLVWKHRDQIETLFRGPIETPTDTTIMAPPPTHVTALARIKPAGGLIRIAGPARFVVVVDELLVERGDSIEENQLVATLESIAVERAEVARIQAELTFAELELARTKALLRDELVSEAELDRASAERDIVAANLTRAEAELERSHVRSPIHGRVLDVWARSGEKVGEEGIVEVADTREMVVVAEVYETDITKVKAGMRASVRSPALPGGEIFGVVSRVGLKISRKDVLDSDPVADANSRVVEVEISLDSSRAAATLTNLRVEVAIDIGS